MTEDDEQRSIETSEDVQDRETTRRNIIKTTGAATAAGALGSLAGCLGGGDGGDTASPTPEEEDTPTDETTTEGGEESTPSGDGGDTAGGDGGDTGTASGEAETVTLDYWSQFPTANPQVREWYPTTLDRFEEMQDGQVNVSLNPVTPSGLLTQVRAAVEAGNPPDISGRGELAIDLYPNGVTIDHGNYIREANYEENLVRAGVTGAEFRDVWISMARPASTVWTMGLRPKFFKDVGIDEPSSQLTTWTDYRRAIEQIDEQNESVWAHEVTGVWNDLETYWGEAHTAFSGEDPWMEGPGTDPTVKIGENDKTDGMIKNVISLADAYSSDQAASRGDEDIPSLMFTDRVASYNYGLGGWQRYETVNQDATFGWDGDVYEQPLPKLDPNYGEEFDIPELAGKEGMRGGFGPALGGTMIFEESEHKEEAWQLEQYLKTNEDHLLTFRTEKLPRPPTWEPVLETIREDRLSELPQIYQAVVNAKLSDFANNIFGCGDRWEVFGASEIRWEMNRIISNTMAGQGSVDDLPSRIRETVLSMLEERNQGQSIEGDTAGNATGTGTQSMGDTTGNATGTGTQSMGSGATTNTSSQ